MFLVSRLFDGNHLGFPVIHPEKTHPLTVTVYVGKSLNDWPGDPVLPLLCLYVYERGGRGLTTSLTICFGYILLSHT